MQYPKADFGSVILPAFKTAYGNSKTRTFKKAISSFRNTDYGNKSTLGIKTPEQLVDKNDCIKKTNDTYTINFNSVKTEEDFIWCLTVLYGVETDIYDMSGKFQTEVINHSTAFMDWYKILVGLQQKPENRPDAPN
jgi:hypothetical protein